MAAWGGLRQLLFQVVGLYHSKLKFDHGLWAETHIRALITSVASSTGIAPWLRVHIPPTLGLRLCCPLAEKTKGWTQPSITWTTSQVAKQAVLCGIKSSLHVLSPGQYFK